MLYVDIPTRADLQHLIADRGPARVTIYLPTTPLTQHAQADRIALKNHTRTALDQLAAHDKREVLAIEAQLLDLIDDDEYWAVQANSLAVFASAAGLRSFRLPNRLQPIVEVSDRFHLKPLLRSVTVPQSAFVLALAQNSARVVEVSADLPAHEVKLEEMPRDAASAAGKASIQDRSPSGRIQGSEGIKVRLTQYARKVDRVLREFLGGREIPVILAAAEPLRSIYRNVQTHPHFAASSIDTNPEAMTDAELAAAARSVLDERFRTELAEIGALFAQRSNEQRTTTDVATAARAATWGAVDTLVVDIDTVVPGTVDDQGRVSFAEGQGPSSYGIVDEIAVRALIAGARVISVRRDEVPGGGDLAAILRYAL